MSGNQANSGGGSRRNVVTYSQQMAFLGNKATTNNVAVA